MKQGINDKIISVCGMKINMIQIPEVITIMESWIRNKDYSNYISVSNAYCAGISKKDVYFRRAVNNSSLSVPDGISLVLLARLNGYNLKSRVYGPDLMTEFLKKAEEKGYSNFFYGYRIENLNLLVNSLRKKFPGLKIAGVLPAHIKKSTEEENRRAVEIINEAKPDILWVGLGCPRQEVWMYEYKDKLRVHVMLGVGAAFDFLSGTKPQAPAWIRNNGFEWLFRLACEPRRLWKRYLVNGSLFFYYAAEETIKYKFKKTKKDYV